VVLFKILNIAFGKLHIFVLHFNRSQPVCNEEVRQQYNILTSYIDASNVYGSDQVILQYKVNWVRLVHFVNQT